MKKQAGFTLVEIAIVLVIIGLLLGGVLKGQELIESAKVKNIAQDMRSIAVAVMSYQDKYRAMPGDDPNARARWGDVACALESATPPLGDGLIDQGEWTANNPSTPTKASCVWNHLRLAGLLTGDPSAVGPSNADGGIFGVVSTVAQGGVAGIPGTLIVCAGSIRGRHVIPLDAMLDNGIPDTGSMRAAAGTQVINKTAVALNAVVDSDPYTVCMGF
ncbi:MAG: prepilin-type N-terminal cleavage/methylation domain-containing protein [Betaproteobacteria bacterium]|nr:prepilin-type N-terminal cleavage/methylation domain-containing protein [Betaproteobacteria bacterium]